MSYQSSKVYGHHLGLSAVFRQWRASSHCNQLHGYALSFAFIFQADELDSRNWVVDFGALKPLKSRLENLFDHKLVIAGDDPHKHQILALADAGIADVVVMEAVGCEAFASVAYGFATLTLINYLQDLQGLGIRPPKNLRVVSCECREHGANGALYQPE